VSEKKVILGGLSVGRTVWWPQKSSPHCRFARRDSAAGRAKPITSSSSENAMAQNCALP
jgi:hypothetical protein